MQKKALKGTLIACGLALSGATFAGAPSGAMLGHTCAGCHGTYGNSVGPATPTIAAMDPEVFLEAMIGYKDGSRTATIMDRIARGYSEDEFKAMAEFFAKQKFKAADQTADAALAKKGAKLHDKYCEKCHEDGGKTAEDGGILAGQWLPYLSYRMEDYLADPDQMGKKMRKKVKKMRKKAGDESIKQVLHFYAGQK